MMSRIPISKSNGSNRFGSHCHSRGEYFSWDDIQMVKAMTSVEMGMSIRWASEVYRVPRSTLHDRISGDQLLILHKTVNRGQGKHITGSE